MHDQRDGRDGGRDQGRDGGGDRRREGEGGPQGTEFLELELSRMLLSRASEVAQEAAIELMREALKERLRERIGGELAAIGRLAADELADDVAANLEIEARIVARMQSAAGVHGRLRAALAQGARASEPRAAAPRRRRGKR